MIRTTIKSSALHFGAVLMMILLLPFLVGATSAAKAADYVIDTKGAHAAINYKVSHLGYSFVVGRFDRFTGTFTFDEKSPETSHIVVDIDTTSINSNHAARDKHLRSADFLDVAKFPKAKFESTAIKMTGKDSATIMGKLTLHGVTKDITINAKHIGGGKDPWGGFRNGFTGETSFKMDDFGINTSHLGPTAKMVNLELVVEGIRKK